MGEASGGKIDPDAHVKQKTAEVYLLTPGQIQEKLDKLKDHPLCDFKNIAEWSALF